MRILAVLILVLTTSFGIFSQEIGEETRNGQLYKVHAVEAGNTLYGLHKKYNVAIDEIIKANPSAKEGLQIGQKLYIPVKAAEPQKQDLTFTLHKVKRKETLYGISRQYDCTVAALIELNPGVENGLSIGEEIKIPTGNRDADKEIQTETPQEEVAETQDPVAVLDSTLKVGDTVIHIDYQVDFRDSIVEYEVQKGETLYSISRRFMVPVEELVAQNSIRNNAIKPGQILKITLKQERIQEVEVREIVKLDSSLMKRPNLIAVKEKYKILVALPMKISDNPKVLSGMYTEETSLNGLTDLSVEFLMGAQMAIDSLEQLGLNADIEFYDTDGNLNRFKEYLGSTNKKNLDMIIGPFYPNLLAYAAEWGKSNKVPVIAVTKIPTKTLENNPYLLSMVPSDLTLISGMAKYLAKHHPSANIVIVDGENTEVNERIAYFKDVFNKSLAPGKSASIKMSAIGDVSGRILVRAIDADQKNFVICLSNDVQQVMKFVNTLNAAKNYTPKYGKADITMVGLQEWRDIEALNTYYKNRFEFTFAATNYLNYETEKTIPFIHDYRARYGSDPSKYAFHGYDVLLSQGAYLFLGHQRNEGLMNHFSVQPLGFNHGSENSSVFISKQSDFEIHLLEIISNNNHFEVEQVEQRGDN